MLENQIKKIISRIRHFVGFLIFILRQNNEQNPKQPQERRERDNVSQLIPEVAVLKQIISQKSTVIDIGANIGEFTKILHDLIKPDGVVYSFEPQYGPFKLLQESCRNMANVNIFNFGMSDVMREATLFIPIVDGRTSPAEASVDSAFNLLTGPERLPKADVSVSEKIKLHTLDDFIHDANLDALDFVKIDVEGHELEVLKGGSGFVLPLLRPVFLIEVFPYVYKGHLEEVCRYMEGYQYGAYVLNSEQLKLWPLNRENYILSRGYNYFYLPREKIAMMASIIGLDS